eukprot:4866329-Prymnesium_polylepis.2
MHPSARAHSTQLQSVRKTARARTLFAAVEPAHAREVQVKKVEILGGLIVSRSILRVRCPPDGLAGVVLDAERASNLPTRGNATAVLVISTMMNGGKDAGKPSLPARRIRRPAESKIWAAPGGRAFPAPRAERE